jgi:hypothetical protein
LIFYAFLLRSAKSAIRIYDALMDAYLLSASVGCGFVLKAPTVGKQLQFLV